MKVLVILLTLLFNLSCNAIGDHPERIDKLRAIGVDTDQANYSFSESGQTAKTATLSFLLLTKDAAPVVSSLVADSGYAALSELTQTEESFAEMRLIRINAKITIPTEAEALLFDDDGSALLPYALRIVQGDEEELIRSRLRVLKEGDAKLSFSKPSVNLDELKAKAPLASGTINLLANITKTQDEPYRVSWFVADGEIEKRRAEDAEWTKVGAGTKTLVVTVRGLDSLRFSYAVVDLLVQ